MVANVTPSVFKIVQSYGGLKKAYFEVADMDSDDTILFTDNNVVGIYYITAYEENDTSGRVLLSFIIDDLTVPTTYANEVTLMTSGKSTIKVSGVILFRDY